jgi:hypothetical protein
MDEAQIRAYSLFQLKKDFGNKKKGDIHAIGAAGFPDLEIIGDESISMDDINPIQINSIWLNKLGFTKTSDGFVFKLSSFCYLCSDKSYNFFVSDSNTNRIMIRKPEYVHCLQNILLALSGFDFDIINEYK